MPPALTNPAPCCLLLTSRQDTMKFTASSGVKTLKRPSHAIRMNLGIKGRQVPRLNFWLPSLQIPPIYFMNGSMLGSKGKMS